MRLLTFTAGDEVARIGALDESGQAPVVVDLTGPCAELGVTRMEEVVAMDGPVWPRLRVLGAAENAPELPRHPLSGVTLLPPLTAPSQMPFVRTNYPAPDGTRPALDRPSFFSKLPSTLTCHEADILLPGLSTQVDWEAELAVVIGRKARRVSPEAAMDHIAGYTITNDITARDIQATGEQTLAKNFRTFAPLGPWIVTTDEVEDPSRLVIRQWVNDHLFQEGSTGDMVFGIPEIVSFLSSVTDLHPGDVVATGSPAGIGLHQEPPVFLRPGDRLRVEIEGIGVLSNRAVSGR